jgi:hypothetical protein
MGPRPPFTGAGSLNNAGRAVSNIHPLPVSIYMD